VNPAWGLGPPLPPCTPFEPHKPPQHFLAMSEEKEEGKKKKMRGRRRKKMSTPYTHKC